jgi:BirA family transcriptional regulator, biotin operon repressor / biotin---[acetyl-CoA-carboxylase] ligase
VVVGAGVNVEWREFPPELAETATACDLEAGHAVDRRELLAAFLAELDRRYADLGGVVDEYQKRLATQGRRVRVERSDGDLVGRAVGIGDAGQLRVEDDHGNVLEVHVGDVVHLRDA